MTPYTPITPDQLQPGDEIEITARGRFDRLDHDGDIWVVFGTAKETDTCFPASCLPAMTIKRAQKPPSPPTLEEMAEALRKVTGRFPQGDAGGGVLRAAAEKDAKATLARYDATRALGGQP